ncbi:unnamed protein product [Larinioides sclopetarius]|uniref:Amidase domain-containing protein n=1 Tax=Larinioides sclopetarius TaxID=280406 RepID=A0AAV2B3S0_9ARAC
MKETFWYWFFRILTDTIRFLWHCVLSFKYGGKGKVVSPVTNPLLLKSATKLAQEIREGKLKSEEVVQAYIDRILEVDPLINATVDRCFEDAIKKAKEVDSLIASGNYSREYLSKEKPLLGVPFSIKLLFYAKGLRCTAGYKAFEHFVATKDAPAVALMKNAGGILITSTNVPELATNSATVNKLHGTTYNPYNTNRTSGGSSGGESALIAAGGSVLGIGNDLMGSLRLPAHFTGIFAHKPTKGLIPNEGCFPPEKPDEPTNPKYTMIYKYVSTGPMCRYAEDLIISMKSLSSSSGIKLNFGEKVNFRKIKVLYLKQIRSLMVPLVHKDITSTLEKAVSYFENRYNITAQEVKMPFLFDASRCVVNILLQCVTHVKEIFLGGADLGFNEKVDFLKALIRKSVLCFSSLAIFNLTYFPLWYKKDRTVYYQDMLEDWTKEFDKLLDENTVLLMPTSPVVAPYSSEVTLAYPSLCYTAVFNVLGLPATHCPMGFTKQGLPYGIQIIGRANNDALTIACAVELERAFGGWKSPVLKLSSSSSCQVPSSNQVIFDIRIDNLLCNFKISESTIISSLIKYIHSIDDLYSLLLGQMLKMKEIAWHWLCIVIHNLFGIIRFLWYCVLSLKYGGKGKVVPPVKNPLLLKSATKLAQEIREGKLKSEDVVQAYIDRILEVEPLINATVDRCFETAIQKAREVDSLIASGSYSREYLGKEKPLLGVPITIKLIFMVKGLRCTAGYKDFENLIAKRDASVVALMKKAGAILIASTNIPELPCNMGCKNKLHGTTYNPYDTKRTSGGSSGGEGALIAAGGSVFGIGNDMAGSVRIPAHFTGIFAHKPTRGLVPSDGCFPPERPDKPSKASELKIYNYISPGPMCRYSEDLIISMQCLSSTNEVALRFDEKAVSYFENRYNIAAQEVKFPFLEDANRCVISKLFQCVTKSVNEIFLGGGELGFSEKTDFLKSFIGKSVLCVPTLAVLNFAYFPLIYRKDRTLYYQNMLEDWIKEFDKLLDENTVLLMPPSPVVAPYNSEVTLLFPSICYTSIFNILGLPATQCPMGFTKQGLPFGIQVVGRANNDALTIACTIELEKAFGGWKSPGEVKEGCCTV